MDNIKADFHDYRNFQLQNKAAINTIESEFQKLKPLQKDENSSSNNQDSRKSGSVTDFEYSAAKQDPDLAFLDTQFKTIVKRREDALKLLKSKIINHYNISFTVDRAEVCKGKAPEVCI